MELKDFFVTRACRRRTWAGPLLAAVLALSGCGGGGGSSSSGESSQPELPAIPSHAEATLSLTDANTPFLLAHAQAVQKSMHRWASMLILETSDVSPAQPLRTAPCSVGNVSTAYKDLDSNGRESVGDQIEILSTACSSITPLGDGRTLLTVLAVNGSDFTDSRVVADGTLDESTLDELWSQRLSGTFRIFQVSDIAVRVQSEGDVQLTLRNGRVLKLRNLALTYTVRAVGAVSDLVQSGQFDLFFENGPSAGALVQIDTLGELTAGGQNQWPTPGQLQISGRNGTRARLTGNFVNGVGAQFETLVDTAGTGQFRQLSVLNLEQFYSAVQ